MRLRVNAVAPGWIATPLTQVPDATSISASMGVTMATRLPFSMGFVNPDN